MTPDPIAPPYPLEWSRAASPSASGRTSAVVRDGGEQRRGCSTERAFPLLTTGAGIILDEKERQTREQRIDPKLRLSGWSEARVPGSFLENYAVALPHESTQQRIVSQLDELSDRSGAPQRRVEAAASVLRRLRRSATAAGAAGRLTGDWRLSRGRVDGDEFPAGWAELTIGEAAECLDSKRRPVNAKERGNRLGSVPYYGANGPVGWIDEVLLDEPLVLVVEDATFTGRAKPPSYLIDGPSWVNNHAHVLRARELVSPTMLNLALFFYDFVPLTSGTTGRRKLNQAALVSAPLLLPPRDEQDETVLRVETVLDRLTEATERLERARLLIDSCRDAAVIKALASEQDSLDSP